VEQVSISYYKLCNMCLQVLARDKYPTGQWLPHNIKWSTQKLYISQANKRAIMVKCRQSTKCIIKINDLLRLRLLLIVQSYKPPTHR